MEIQSNNKNTVCHNMQQKIYIYTYFTSWEIEDVFQAEFILLSTPGAAHNGRAVCKPLDI